MPTTDEHIDQAVHNIEVTVYLLKEPDFCDWAATVVFYTALHIVEALIYRDKQIRTSHGHNHETRGSILKNTRAYSNISKHYGCLERASIIARYMNDQSRCKLKFSEYLPAEDVKNKLIKNHLANLIKSAGKKLPRTAKQKLNQSFKTFFS